MSKTYLYTCSKCDAQFPKWSGRCTACGSWGSIAKDEETAGDFTAAKNTRPAAAIKSFAQSANEKSAELKSTGLAFFDFVLGGGLVDGSITLAAGEPGIGKSTLLAQLALQLAAQGEKILYITGEESPAQISRRLLRLTGQIPASLFFLDYLEAATIAATLEKERPYLTIVDSIQCVRLDELPGEAGSVNQVKASAATLAGAAKRSGLPVILVGQVTKDGDVAGPRVLEHLVDTVLFLEGDQTHRYRLLRALKHRFGTTDEIALLIMTGNGLEPVEDVSSELLRDRTGGVSGSSVTCLIEGRRSILLEIQALVSPAGYGTPVRRATGIDNARMGMLLAVLARRASVNALDKDVYVNAAGGIDARDPSVDLAICTSIAGALNNAPLDAQTAVFGEVGLGGELRPVSLPELRLKEIARLGFNLAVVPKGQSKTLPAGLQAIEAANLHEALKILKIH